ncbi:SufE family protein [Blattabacterium cuenoti]|nr:SufE family protein [Blattabacterium cuenoti]
MTLKNQKEWIKKKFFLFNNWEEKYEYIIYLGKNLKKKSDKFRSKDKLIYGCQSKVWLEAKLIGKRIFFDADSDALLPKGMVALMISVYSGHFPFEIISSNDNYISEIGLKTFLSPNRANGIFLFLKKIKLYAIAFNELLSIKNKKN